MLSSGAGLCPWRERGSQAGGSPGYCKIIFVCLLTYRSDCRLSLSRFRGPLLYLELFFPVHGSTGCFTLCFSHPPFSECITFLHILVALEELVASGHSHRCGTHSFRDGLLGGFSSDQEGGCPVDMCHYCFLSSFPCISEKLNVPFTLQFPKCYE